MSKAKRCDRCGNYEERTPDLPDLQTMGMLNIPAEIHLCTSCEDGFREWFNQTEHRSDIQ